MKKKNPNPYRCECGDDLPGRCPGPAVCPYSSFNDDDDQDDEPTEDGGE